MNIFIDAEELLDKNLSEYLFVDCRTSDKYNLAHFHGAKLLPIDYWLKENNSANVARGERLISKSDFCEVARSIGLSNESKVILYDDNENRASCRVAWVFSYFGIKNITILNGGFEQLMKIEPRVLKKSSCEISGCNFSTEIDASIFIDDATLSRELNNIKIIDARSLGEWNGSDLHGNPRNGHLPNAIFLPWDSFIDKSTKKFISKEAVLKTFHNVGLNRQDSIVTYCQAGVRAAVLFWLLKACGFSNVRVFDASMFTWSRNNNYQLIKE